MTCSAGADPTNPDYYKGSAFESINVIERTFHSHFHIGNAFKYIARHQKKGGKLDIEKAIWYLARWIGKGSVDFRKNGSSPWSAREICENFELEDLRLQIAITHMMEVVSCDQLAYAIRAAGDSLWALQQYLADYDSRPI